MPILSELRKTENTALGVGGVTYYNTLDSLPITGLTSGDQAFVSATGTYVGTQVANQVHRIVL